MATATCKQSSCNANTNTANRPGTEVTVVAGGTTTADDSEASGSTQTTKEKIWLSTKFWEFVDLLLSQSQVAAVKQNDTLQGQQKILEM